MDGFVICGGKQTDVSCIQFTDGAWVKIYDPIEIRGGHRSWFPRGGDWIVLIGGQTNKNSELVPVGGGLGTL